MPWGVKQARALWRSLSCRFSQADINGFVRGSLKSCEFIDNVTQDVKNTWLRNIRLPISVYALSRPFSHINAVSTFVVVTDELWKLYADKTVDVAMLQAVHANEGSSSVAVVDYSKMWSLNGMVLAPGDQVNKGQTCFLRSTATAWNIFNCGF